MRQFVHEIRDPIHVFIRLDSDERRVLNSRPFQRLRHIHQLAMTYLVYPGATHKRFEHSLGVMELSSRVFDIVTDRANVCDEIWKILQPISQPDQRSYWRRVLRMAALCHDMGHLPFSHAAENDLLPEGWDHERLTRQLISSPEMQEIWHCVTPPLREEDIVKLAIGPKKAGDLAFSDWEAILAEIITGDAFGVDRMDYLLRDSHHAGVAYGKFDHYRLIDTLRILPTMRSGEGRSSREPVLGMEEGGLQSAEALMLARYFMYSQVYFHKVRRIYDIHLVDFLKEWCSDGFFSTDLDRYLEMTDSKITDILWKAAFAKDERGHAHARRIVRREHFKLVYRIKPEDMKINLQSGKQIFESLASEFGEALFRYDHYRQKSNAVDFPLRMSDGDVVSSLSLSTTLKNIPTVVVDHVYADRSCVDEAHNWVEQNRADIIKPDEEEDHE